MHDFVDSQGRENACVFFEQSFDRNVRNADLFQMKRGKSDDVQALSQTDNSDIDFREPQAPAREDRLRPPSRHHAQTQRRTAPRQDRGLWRSHLFPTRRARAKA
jgi:hypothetical protein